MGASAFQQRPGASHEPQDEALAERLDQLSMEEAQRVLERAVSASSPLGSDPGLSQRQLYEIAAELGIDAEHVDRALEAELIAHPIPRYPGLLARVTGLPTVCERRITDRPPPWVQRAAAAWLGGEEGLRARYRSASGAVWERDRGLTARLRRAFRLTRGSGTLGVADQVSHKVEAVHGGRTLVTLQADAGSVLRSGGVVAIGTLLVATLLVMIGGLAGEWGQGFGAAVVMLGVGLGATVTALRVWALRLRRAVTGALDAIVGPGPAEPHLW
jgi:hypothetical protein